MRHFRIRFCNDLTDSYGRQHHACQREIEVPASLGRDRAIEAAKREFERLEGISSWTHRARTIECELPTDSPALVSAGDGE